jgi:prephenate dehydrogenase
LAGPSHLTPPLLLKRKARSARTVAIIGTGLIGTSVGLALRRASKGTRIIGYDRRASVARVARRRGALTSVAPSLEAAVRAADITVLAVPLTAVIKFVPLALKYAHAGSLVIDVAGLKAPVLAAATPLLAKKNSAGFCGGHPLAGRERGGPDAATSDLFQGRPFALCVPKQPGESTIVTRAASFVRSLGARPLFISARDHDRVVAATSALPQIVSSATASAVAGIAKRNRGLIGPGFESVARLAESPAEIWTALLLANKRNIVPAVAALEGQLRNFRQAIERYNGVHLRQLLRSGAKAQRRMKS